VDLYIFPNPNSDPATQVKNTINAMQGALGGNMIWFDIEAPSAWNSDCSANVAWLQKAISTAISVHSGGIGIYSSASQWGPIMCSSTDFSSYPLWYAHYDGNPSFSDFSPFGGWNSPAIKQYQGTTSICGTSIDKDYY
jgi:GH25 family lysozyme M1 (1,4-beta-N-acetylmuramidase)